jgi:hypothetical protein
MRTAEMAKGYLTPSKRVPAGSVCHPQHHLAAIGARANGLMHRHFLGLD